MAIEKWLAVTSVALFAMFAGEMISVYNFMLSVEEDFGFARSFDANAKIIQFISIGVAPAGVLAAVAFIMSKQYGSRQIGGLIVVGGIILFVGMLVCYSMIEKIDDIYLTDTVKFLPILFMVLSGVVIAVGAYLSKQKKKRPKKEYF
jgi:activator of 2-hydroxyglutaryl-CoA dehydratase